MATLFSELVSIKFYFNALVLQKSYNFFYFSITHMHIAHIPMIVDQSVKCPRGTHSFVHVQPPLTPAERPISPFHHVHWGRWPFAINLIDLCHEYSSLYLSYEKARSQNSFWWTLLTSIIEILESWLQDTRILSPWKQHITCFLILLLRLHTSQVFQSSYSISSVPIIQQRAW